MTRLIDADSLYRKGFDVYISEYGCDEYHFDETMFSRLIESEPSVDAVLARHGKWKLIRMEDNGDGFYTCSNCDRGDIHSPLVSVPYCWYCGARMDAE